MVYLQIHLDVAEKDRSAAAAIYNKFKEQFLTKITGAKSKELLVRAEDVQVMHGFDTSDDASAYLESSLFNDDVVTALKPLLQSPPTVRIYSAY